VCVRVCIPVFIVLCDTPHFLHIFCDFSKYFGVFERHTWSHRLE